MLTSKNTQEDLYEAPELNVVRLDMSSVIATSGTLDDPSNGYDPFNDLGNF